MRVIVLLRYSFEFYVDDRGKGGGVKRQVSHVRKRGADGLLTISCDDVPCCRIERYGCQRKEERHFGRVDEGTERHDCYVVVEDNRATTVRSCTVTAKKFTYIDSIVYATHPDTDQSVLGFI